MKIEVSVKANAKKEEVVKTAENTYRVSVKAAPREGKANEAVARALANYFEVPKSAVSLCSGAKSKLKIFEIPL